MTGEGAADAPRRFERSADPLAAIPAGRRTFSRHFDRAERAEKSGWRRAPGGCRSLRRRRSARRVSPLRPGPVGRGSGRNDGRGGGGMKGGSGGGRPAVSGDAQPPRVISTERSERRNPAGDGRRADAGACGVGGAPAGFLHSAPARRAGPPVEMTGEGAAAVPPFRASRKPPSVIPAGRRTPLAVISTERSERRNPASDGRRADAGACGVGGAPAGFLHSAPDGAPVEMTDGGRNDGMGSRTGLGARPAGKTAPAPVSALYAFRRGLL